MPRIHKVNLALGVILLFGLVVSSPSSAQITNGGFELAFTGWLGMGNYKIKDASYGSGPTQGTAQALLSTKRDKNKFNDTELEEFLGLALGSLDGLGYGNARHGSAIKQTFFANAGDVLSFDWNFLTNEGPYNDFAFVAIGGLSGLASSQTSLLAPSLAPVAQETGFHTFSIVLAATGMYTLGLGVVNVHNKKLHSGLLIDNVALNHLSVPTPEPSTMILLGMGLAGLVAAKRKYKK